MSSEHSGCRTEAWGRAGALEEHTTSDSPERGQPGVCALTAVLQGRSLRPREEVASPLEVSDPGLKPKRPDSVTLPSAAAAREAGPLSQSWGHPGEGAHLKAVHTASKGAQPQDAAPRADPVGWGGGGVRLVSPWTEMGPFA